ncbi:uncharacterized protein LOC143276663 [Babylonia areolata]|uniref:uncharacterized protein LOC143276663 n=1 Tax=Babylonia areolata TaxID=304850 RepID=UPI003FD532ED
MKFSLQQLFVFALLALPRCGATEGDSILCAYRDVRPGGSSSSSSSSSSSGSGSGSSSSSSSRSSLEEMLRNLGGEIQDDNLTIRCHSNIYCFTLWNSGVHNNKSTVSVLKQGCWIGEANVCKQGGCVSSMAPKNNSHFCCCSGDMCNLNFTDGYDPAAHTTTTPFIPSRPPQDHSYRIKTIIISLVSVFSAALVIMVAYFGFRMCTRPKHPSVESLHGAAVPESPPVVPEFDMDDLKLCSIVSKGRYAEVWRGKLEDRDVAVKIYSPHYREYYNNERSLYRLPFMDHQGLVKFYGADERITQEGWAQLMIVMSYFPLGSLNGYLKNNTLDWPTMVSMAYSVAKALSHLHTDIQKADQFKPVLAHRDLNTRNILVRPDLTCVVSDLGFAIATMGSKLIKKGHAEVAEQTSLTDVGTLRYMAPELLDGAVNLRDCEASLKQIDIYALGLVLWEIAMRCVDLYQGAPVPEYTPPFQTEIGSSPTFEEMQLMVVRAKKRPRFPEVWKETNQAVRSLKETIEECWDADAEARLTALCVEERLSELPNLWAHEIKHRGMTPTLNAMINITETTTTTTTTTTTAADTTSEPADVGTHAPTAHDNDSTSTAPLLANGHAHGSSSSCGGGGVGGGGEFFSSRSPSVLLTRSWLQDASVSTGTTDTLLPVTPASESVGVVGGGGGGGGSGAPPVPLALSLPVKASNLMQERNSTVLRPHRGRNPTVERNTHKRSDEELRVSGNTLLTSSGGTSSSLLLFPEERRDSLSTQSAPSENPSGGTAAVAAADSPPDYLSDGPETSLVQNDALSHRNPPIPYLQNQVHGGNAPSSGRPKVANTTSSSSSARSYGRGGERSSLRDKLSRLIRPKEFGWKLSALNFFGGGRRHDYSRADDLEVEDLNQDTPTAVITGGGNSGGGNNCQPSHHASGAVPSSSSSSQHSNLQPINTEVSIHNGSAVTRPTNLALSAFPNLRQAAAASSRPCSNLRNVPPAREMTVVVANEDSIPRMVAATTTRAAESNSGVEAVAREESSSTTGSGGGGGGSGGGREGRSRSESHSGSDERSREVSGSERSREVSVGSATSAAARDSQSEGTDDVFVDRADVDNDDDLRPTERSEREPKPARYPPENRLRFAEVGVAKLHVPAVNQQPVRRVQGQGHSKSLSELLHLHNNHHQNPSCVSVDYYYDPDSCWQETELTSSSSSQGCPRIQRRRPNSLSLKGHNYNSPAPLGGGKPPLLHTNKKSSSSSKPDMSTTTTTDSTNKPTITKQKHAVVVSGDHTNPAPPKQRRSDSGSSGGSAASTTAQRSSSAEEVHRSKDSTTRRSQHQLDSLAAVPAAADPSEKIRRRVKTPVRPAKKAGGVRLSLYDDRLMSSEGGQCGNGSGGGGWGWRRGGGEGGGGQWR